MTIELLYALIGAAGGTLFIYSTKQFTNPETVLSVGLLVAAAVYIVFSLLWGDLGWTATEVGGVLLYSLFYVAGRKYDFRWVGAGWLLHPLWDAVLHIYGAGHFFTPFWYGWVCVGFDVLVGVYILAVYRRH